MPWATWTVPVAGQQGFLYNVTIYARGQSHLNYPEILRAAPAPFGLLHVLVGFKYDLDRVVGHGCA